jgi:hypothetical protein
VRGSEYGLQRKTKRPHLELSKDVLLRGKQRQDRLDICLAVHERLHGTPGCLSVHRDVAAVGLLNRQTRTTWVRTQPAEANRGLALEPELVATAKVHAG